MSENKGATPLNSDHWLQLDVFPRDAAEVDRIEDALHSLLAQSGIPWTLNTTFAGTDEAKANRLREHNEVWSR